MSSFTDNVPVATELGRVIPAEIVRSNSTNSIDRNDPRVISLQAEFCCTKFRCYLQIGFYVSLFSSLGVGSLGFLGYTVYQDVPEAAKKVLGSVSLIVLVLEVVGGSFFFQWIGDLLKQVKKAEQRLMAQLQEVELSSEENQIAE